MKNAITINVLPVNLQASLFIGDETIAWIDFSIANSPEWWIHSIDAAPASLEILPGEICLKSKFELSITGMTLSFMFLILEIESIFKYFKCELIIFWEYYLYCFGFFCFH